jgi:hypothetical protein
VQVGLTVIGVALQGLSFAGGGGGMCTQMPKAPSVKFPRSQILIHTVLPGTSPPAVIMGMNPLELASSSHAIKVSALHVPL